MKYGGGLEVLILQVYLFTFGVAIRSTGHFIDLFVVVVLTIKIWEQGKDVKTDFRGHNGQLMVGVLG